MCYTEAREGEIKDEVMLLFEWRGEWLCVMRLSGKHKGIWGIFKKILQWRQSKLCVMRKSESLSTYLSRLTLAATTYSCFSTLLSVYKCGFVSS